jgi:hypothetical protein
VIGPAQGCASLFSYPLFTLDLMVMLAAFVVRTSRHFCAIFAQAMCLNYGMSQRKSRLIR